MMFRFLNTGLPLQRPLVFKRGLSSSSADTRSGGAKGPLSWMSLGAVALVGTGIVIYNNYMKEQKKLQNVGKVESFGKPLLGGPWSLVRSDGVPVTSGDYKGKYLLMYFGFTYCPDICPNELVKMVKVSKILSKKLSTDQFVPVFVTLDPGRDSCAQLRSYVEDFSPNIVGLTGTPEQLKNITKKFRVYYSDFGRDNSEAENDDEYLVDHSIVCYLMSPDGDFLEFFSQLATEKEIAQKVEDIVSGKIRYNY